MLAGVHCHRGQASGRSWTLRGGAAGRGCSGVDADGRQGRDGRKHRGGVPAPGTGGGGGEDHHQHGPPGWLIADMPCDWTGLVTMNTLYIAVCVLCFMFWRLGIVV